MIKKGDVKIVPRKKGTGNGIKLTNPAGPRHGRLVSGDEVDVVFPGGSKPTYKAHKPGWGEVTHGEPFFLIATPPLPGGACSLVTYDPATPGIAPAPSIPMAGLWADPPTPLTWAQLVSSTFFLELPNWPVWLKSCHQLVLPTKKARDQYLSAEGGGGHEVRADREIPGLWETFTLIRLTQRDDNWLQPGDLVCLQAPNGQYLTAEGGGGREVMANRARPSDWETFIIEEVNATGTPAPLPPGQKIQHGDSITLRTQDNKYYMTAEKGPNDGGGAVNMNRAEAGDWERFIISFPESSPGP